MKNINQLKKYIQAKRRMEQKLNEIKREIERHQYTEDKLDEQNTEPSE